MKIKKFLLVCTLVLATVLSVLGIASCNDNATLQAKAESVSTGANNEVLSDEFFSLNYNTELVDRGNNVYARRYKLTYDFTKAQMTPYLSSDSGSFVFKIELDEDVKMEVLLEVNSSSVEYSYKNYGFGGYNLSFSTNRVPLFTVASQTLSNNQNWISVGSVKSNGNILPNVYGEDGALYIDLWGDSNKLDNYAQYKLRFDYSILRQSDEKITWYESKWDKFWNNDPKFCNRIYVVTNQQSEYDSVISYEPTNFYSDKTLVDTEKCVCTNTSFRKTGLSLVDLFEEKFEDGTALAYFGDYYDTAYGIAYNVITEKVTIRYLKDIEGTPFAYKCEEKLEVTYAKGSTELTLDVVKSAFNNADKVFPVTACGSFVDRVVANADRTAFEVTYLSSVYVKMRSSDGYSDGVILDCNKSFKDYFEPFVATYGVEDGEKIVDWILNDVIVKKYPALTDTAHFNESEYLYGLWGFSVIPANELDFFKDMIVYENTKTQATDNVKFYDYSGRLTSAQYNELLEDYGYFSLFAKVLVGTDKLLKLDNCTFVFFFANDAGDEVISQNGSVDKDNDNSLTENQLHDGINGIMDNFSKFWEDIKAMVGEGNDTLAAFLSGLLCIVGLVGFVYVLVAIFKKGGNDKNG